MKRITIPGYDIWKRRPSTINGKENQCNCNEALSRITGTMLPSSHLLNYDFKLTIEFFLRINSVSPTEFVKYFCKKWVSNLQPFT